MSQTETEKHGSFLDRHHFLLRRLHSLTGIVPLGVFLLFHLTTNSSVAWGGISGTEDSWWLRAVAYFQKEVYFIHELPHLILMEFALWGALLFHSVLGVIFATSARFNTKRYPYGGNFRYTLMRWTGWIGIIFIFYHVATLRWGWSWMVPGGTRWSYEYAASTLAAALRGSPESFTLGGMLVSLGYFIGITAIVYHFANGLWTAAITWGVTISERSQRQWGYACAGIGAAVMLLAWSALFGFLALDHGQAEALEFKMQMEKGLKPPIIEDGVSAAPLVSPEGGPLHSPLHSEVKP